MLLEFNELVSALVERFIAEGRLPNFARLRARSLVAVTDAEEEPPALEPWIQWVTVHTGLRYSEHGVFDLDDGADLKAPRTWDLVQAAGRKAWVCGSMNAFAERPSDPGLLLLPDPWTTTAQPLPPGRFDPYLTVIRAFVQGHHGGGADVTPAQLLAFGRFMVANGLSLRTVVRALRQLAGERWGVGKWRRAVILDRLQWDLFRSVYRAEKPAFASFFLNSTAHYQHFHWREMAPDAFTVQPDPADREQYRDAIAYGYERMDEIVGEALDLCGEGTTIVLCTALSQQPMLSHEETGGKQMFKPVDHARLFALAGITAPYHYAPVMSQQFHLDFASEAEAIDAEGKIATLRLDDGRPGLMLARRNGNRLLSGCNLEAWPHSGATVMGAAANAPVPFTTLFHPLGSVRSGMHHPDGILWISTPERTHRTIDRKVALTELAPTLLELAGVASAHRFSDPVMPELAEPALPELSAAA